MHKHVIFDAERNYVNLIICSDDDSLPDGYIKQKLRDNQYWNFETQKIENIPPPITSITIETV